MCCVYYNLMIMVINQHNREAVAFYEDMLKILADSEIDFMIGGAFAVFHYATIYRDTKDLDIYCRPVDFPAILKLFAVHGYKTEQTDVRWLGKVYSGDGYFIDIIFDTVNGLCKVDDNWFERAVHTRLFDMDIRIIPVEELIWGKLYVQNRERFDGADINHLFLVLNNRIDWKRLYQLVDPHWHLLLSQVLIFQFVYPADYITVIPKWLFDELIARATGQYDIPPPLEKVCRGPLIDQTQYQVDIKKWHYKSYTIKTV